MDGSSFIKHGRNMLEYINKYIRNTEQFPVYPHVKPGYLRHLVPEKAPDQPDTWPSIMTDVEDHIMPGVTHWQHRHFHAYFPAGNSYPSILADMLSDAIGSVGFSWSANPACTELEMIVVDWLAKMMKLPKHFMFSTEGSRGGGVIQGSASECTLVCLLAARDRAIKDLQLKYPDEDKAVLLSKLVAYCSKQAHSSVEKATMIGFVKLRQLPTDENYSLRGSTLLHAIKNDEEKGLVPFYVVGTLGTTSVCSCDNLEELGKVCSERNIWFHCDGAYAGNALICPEFSYLLKGFKLLDSFNFNPNKWMMVNFDCSVMWVRQKELLISAMNVDPLYLTHDKKDETVDYRHWTIPLSRRFRSLKLWFVIRSYGVHGLQNYIRKHVQLAKIFAACVVSDNRFELIGQVRFGLVCFRLLGDNVRTELLLKTINESRKLHLTPSKVDDKFVIRFAICHPNANEDDITYAWNVIQDEVELILNPRMSSDSNQLNQCNNKEQENSSPIMHSLLNKLKNFNTNAQAPYFRTVE
ncbi:aromatic-L-amino-acid decarboxylase-like [Anneissia japonica]|uniref:aromatic-L-amino-acid decarboxylase-like n=1 Tax=Anneissia japonica TaxID=1529436 RepID=UPI001425AED2|nr:aromatic-L-amino-acid decarboxylase-like [Anneissia japonica]